MPAAVRNAAPEAVELSNPWAAFAEILDAEALSLGQLNASAQALTDALVQNVPAAIEVAQRQVDADRIRLQSALEKRHAAEREGVDGTPLAEVLRAAPKRFALRFEQLIAEITTHAIALSITTGNNKALILAGMGRLVALVSNLQQAASEQTGTYQRRGFRPVTDASVLVSSRA